ncbi:MAG TPA: hypothetical protein VK955_04620 [Xanthobacteraceae bacterium]|nr:hypothetical protein [Xanthobacteraceae bacterium]
MAPPYRTLDASVPDDFPLKHEPGWVGAFTRETAAGAIPSGSRCRKVNSEAGDANPDGARGTILGSIRAPGLTALFYYVEWDATPRLAVAVAGWKIATGNGNGNGA